MSDDKADVYRNIVRYAAPCRLGNWNNELAIREEQLLVTSYKRDRCQLLIQKTKSMYRNLLKPSKLAIELPYLTFGENYQFKACEIINSKKTAEGRGTYTGVYLASCITEKEIDNVQNLCHGCPITASMDKTPCARNTFKLVGCERDRGGAPVPYGDDFYIQIVDDGPKPLYVQCENDALHDFGFHLSLRLSEYPDIYCRFRVLHGDAALRYETKGGNALPETKVVIQHVASGRMLAAEPNHLVPTFFGTEMYVSCHTFTNSNKTETAENFWKICGAHQPNLNLYVRAAKGEPIPDELID